MKYVKVLMVLAVLGAYPAVALAHKKPNKSQQAALVKAFNKGVKTPVPSKCLREEISTVNASWAWVEFAFDRKGHLPSGCLKFGANGQTIFHFKAGKWHFVTAGSSFIGSNGGCSLNKKMPRKVVKDLGLC